MNDWILQSTLGVTTVEEYYVGVRVAQYLLNGIAQAWLQKLSVRSYGSFRK